MTDDNTLETSGTVGDDAAFEQFVDADDPVTETATPEAAEEQEEPVAEAAEDEPSDESDESDEAGEDPEPQAEDTAPEKASLDDSVTVEIDGHKVPLGELKKGYLRQADYTRKTQEAAAIRHQAQQLSQAYELQIGQALQIAQAFLPKAPDPALLEYDSAAYLRQKEAFQAAQGHIAGLQQQFHQHKAYQEHQAKAAREHEVTHERKALLERMPELQDTAKAQAFSAELTEALKNYGFQDSDLKDVYDHRVILALKDAMAWRKSQAAKPQIKQKIVAKAEQAKPVVKPTAKQPGNNASSKRADLVQKLRKTGDPKYADKLFEDFV